MSVLKVPAPASASFDDAWYLQTYPDVAEAIELGGFASGYDHWTASGQTEGRLAPPGFLDGTAFDEQAYLKANPDVAEAIRQGFAGSARAHFVTFGSQEGRSLGMPRVPAEGESGVGWFDEAWYLDRNPDIAGAVANGSIESGYAHWLVDGRIEGRSAPPGFNESLVFDEAFYLRAYPLVDHEIAAERALTPRHHYDTVGRLRGYLPNPFADRPGDPTIAPRHSGGLWLDQANAADLIEGRHDIGQISTEQAELLHHWSLYGYVILPRRLPADLVEAAALVVHRAFDGGIDGVRFDDPTLSAYHNLPWDRPMAAGPAQALDLHWLSPAVLQLILAPPVRSFLELVFERRILASRSAASVHGAHQPFHRDTPTVSFSLAQSAVAWIALEDVPPGAGEFTYIPASHKLPQHLYGGRYRSLWDARRMLRHTALQDSLANDPERLEERSEAAGLVARHFSARKGDVVFWHPDLVHGELAPSSRASRAGVMVHYCPREVAPLGFERSPSVVRDLAGQASYATSVYQEP